MTEKAYALDLTIRFRVEADDERAADELAERFGWAISGWIESSGVPPWTAWVMVAGIGVRPIDVSTSEWGIRLVKDEDAWHFTDRA